MRGGGPISGLAHASPRKRRKEEEIQQMPVLKLLLSPTCPMLFMSMLSTPCVFSQVNVRRNRLGL